MSDQVREEVITLQKQVNRLNGLTCSLRELGLQPGVYETYTPQVAERLFEELQVINNNLTQTITELEKTVDFGCLVVGCCTCRVFSKLPHRDWCPNNPINLPYKW